MEKSSSRMPAAQEVDRQPSEAHVPLEKLRRLALTDLAHRRPEIDGHRRDDGRDEQGDGDRDRPDAEADCPVRAQAGQALHRMTASSSPASTSAPSRAWSSPTMPSRAARELVFHLHRFDDHDGLARADGLSRRDGHAHDLARHRRHEVLRPRRAVIPIGRPAAPAAAVERDRALGGADPDAEHSSRGVRHDADVVRGAGPDDQGQRAAIEASRVDVPGPAIDRHGEPASGPFNRDLANPAVDLDFVLHSSRTGRVASAHTAILASGMAVRVR